VDVVADGDGEPDRLGNQVDQVEHVRLGNSQEALGGIDAGGHGDDRRADAVAGAIRVALDGSAPLERGQQAGDRARRQVDRACEVADAPRFTGKGLEEDEGPVDALYGSHWSSLRGVDPAAEFRGLGWWSQIRWTLVFHDTGSSRISGKFPRIPFGGTIPTRGSHYVVLVNGDPDPEPQWSV
jgi:hypothetical protein